MYLSVLLQIIARKKHLNIKDRDAFGYYYEYT